MNEVKLDTKELDRIAVQLGKRKVDILTAVAFEVEAAAKANAPVDTGALSNSIYTVTQEQDNYGAASGAARSANPAVETAPLPKPSGNIVAHVGPSVDYAEYQEFGTSKMAAHPYLNPAVESVRGRFNSGEYFKELCK